MKRISLLLTVTLLMLLGISVVSCDNGNTINNSSSGDGTYSSTYAGKMYVTDAQLYVEGTFRCTIIDKNNGYINLQMPECASGYTHSYGSFIITDIPFVGVDDSYNRVFKKKFDDQDVAINVDGSASKFVVHGTDDDPYVEVLLNSTSGVTFATITVHGYVEKSAEDYDLYFLGSYENYSK